jgi:uncharacterized RDD family membrane protein YckC
VSIDHRAVVETGAAPPSPEQHYAGLVARAIAFVVDAVLVTVVGLVGAGVVAAVLSVVHAPTDAKVIVASIGGFIYVAWTVAYFVVFWCTTGQTPGAYLMGFRVVSKNGATLKPIWALVRYGGVFVSAVFLLGAGFLPIAFDRRRRGLQDFLARTVVIETPDPRHEQGWSGPVPPIPPPARRARDQDGGGRLERSSDAGDDPTGAAREAPPA